MPATADTQQAVGKGGGGEEGEEGEGKREGRLQTDDFANKLSCMISGVNEIKHFNALQPSVVKAWGTQRVGTGRHME